MKDVIFSYHLLQRKLNFIASPQLYEALYNWSSLMVGTVSSSAERGIMCDKILGPDTLNVDMGDFV